MAVQPLAWPPPAGKVRLGPADIHVWSVWLDQWLPWVGTLARGLSADEIFHARRLRFPRDQRRYTVCRGLLRVILGEYAGLPPERLPLERSASGKPFIAPGEACEPSALRFNIAHSGSLALVAVTRGREVGIDAERFRTLPGYEEIARRFFCPEENISLEALCPNQRLRGFYTCWCRKESLVKAIGGGLSIPFDRFRVTADPGVPARLLFIDAAVAGGRDWTLHDLSPASGYAAALAYEGAGASVRCQRWVMSPSCE